jgi:hypothetical protein
MRVSYHALKKSAIIYNRNRGLFKPGTTPPSKTMPMIYIIQVPPMVVGVCGHANLPGGTALCRARSLRT